MKPKIIRKIHSAGFVRVVAKETGANDLLVELMLMSQQKTIHILTRVNWANDKEKEKNELNVLQSKWFV